MPAASMGLFFVLACTGGGSSAAPPPPPTASPELAMKEVTEPWKSMNLPIDGAVVVNSTDASLTLRFAAVDPGEYQLPHNAVRQAFVDQGWTADDDDVGRLLQVYVSKDDTEIAIGTNVSDGRPVMQLTVE